MIGGPIRRRPRPPRGRPPPWVRSSCFWSLAVLPLGVACTCGSEESSDADRPRIARSSVAGPADEAWPASVLAGLPPATPATVVTVHTTAIDVDNRELVATWPASALERASREVPRQETLDWPRIARRLEQPPTDGARIPALQEALDLARRAERASSGAGSGGGVYNLRVASDVPFERVERVLYTASLTGYGVPRLLLRAGSEERMLPWPRGSALVQDALSEDEIEAALAPLRERAAQRDPAASRAPGTAEAARARAENEVAGRPSDATSSARHPRVELGSDLVRAYLGDALQAPGCAGDAEGQEFTFTGDADLEAMARCFRRLHDRAEHDTLTLEVPRDAPFGRLAPLLQHATHIFSGVRLVRRPATDP